MDTPRPMITTQNHRGSQPEPENQLFPTVTTVVDGIEFKIRKTDGYINATALCQQAGKLMKHWNSLESTSEFLAELSSSAGIPTNELIVTLRDVPNHLRGTWVHEDVAIAVTMWISPKFKVACIKVIKAYLKGELQPTDDEIVYRALTIQQKKIEAAEAKIRELTPKAQFCDAVTDSPDLLTFTQVAKWLGMKSAQELTKWLHSQSIIYKQSKTWLPYSRYAQLGYFKIITHTEQVDGESRTFQHTKVTQAGKEFIFRRWNESSSLLQTPNSEN